MFVQITSISITEFSNIFRKFFFLINNCVNDNQKYRKSFRKLNKNLQIRKKNNLDSDLSCNDHKIDYKRFLKKDRMITNLLYKLFNYLMKLFKSFKKTHRKYKFIVLNNDDNV